MSITALVLLACVSFVQNMAFTWTSRSRNSGDPEYHRYASWCSNGIWFMTNMFMLSLVWEPIENGEIGTLLVAGIVYVLSTTEGSVLMMKTLLGRVHLPFLSRLTEKGNKRVGSR